MARGYGSGFIAITNTAQDATHSIDLSAFAFPGAPNYMRFNTVGRTDVVNAAGQRHNDISIGHAVSAASRACTAQHEDDAVSAAQADHVYLKDCVLALLTNTSSGVALDGKIDISSVSETEIVLINRTALGHGIVIQWEAGFFDHAAIAEITEPGATGNWAAVTGLSFQPDYAEFVHTGRPTDNSIGTASAVQLSIGFAKSSTERAVVAINTSDASTSSMNRSYARDDGVIAVLIPNTAVFRADFVSFNADGCTLNCIERNSGRKGYAIFTQGGNVKIDVFSASTSDGGTTVRTGYGFEPLGSLVVGTQQTGPQTADTPSDTQGLSIGVVNTADAHVQATRASASRVSALTVVASAVRFDAAFVSITPEGVVNGHGTVQSFDSDGLTWIQTDATGIADYLVVRSMLPPDFASSETATFFSSSLFSSFLFNSPLLG